MDIGELIMISGGILFGICGIGFFSIMFIRGLLNKYTLFEKTISFMPYILMAGLGLITIGGIISIIF